MCDLKNIKFELVKNKILITRWIILLFYTPLISTYEEHLTLNINTIIVFQIYID